MTTAGYWDASMAGLKAVTTAEKKVDYWADLMVAQKDVSKVDSWAEKSVESRASHLVG